MSALGGAIAGGLVGAAIGTGTGILVGAPLGIGAAASGVAGLLTALYVFFPGAFSFNSQGLPGEQTQTVKLTHQQTLPDLQDSVQVVPNDFQVTEAGTLMSAKLVGPTCQATKTYLVVGGSFSVKIHTPPQAPKAPVAAGNGSGTAPEGTGPRIVGLVPASGASVSSYVLGEITMQYGIQKTWGLQGPLEYLWTFNSVPIGNGPSVKVDIPVTADMFGAGGFRFDKVNYLGTIRVVVDDTFGRQASWEGEVSMGSDKDLRPLRAPGWKAPQWVDWLGGHIKGKHVPLGPPEPGPVVGWSLGIGDVVAPQGTLVAQTLVTSPELRENVIVVCTTTEVMKTR